MASSSELAPLVDDEAVEARARLDVRETFVENSRRWRSAGPAALNVIGYLAMGLAPTIPGAAELLGVSWRLSLPLMLVHSANTVAGVFVLRRHHPLSGPGKFIEVFGTTLWIGSAVAMMAASGSARSVFWVPVGVIVTLLSNSIHHHRRVLGSLGFWMVAITLFFAVEGKWGDAALSAIFGACACYFQRLSTIYGWRLAREHARVELMQERIGELLVAQERTRIERELHDGVAADLTAALWQARAIEGVDHERVDALAAGIEDSLHEMRRIVHEMRAAPSTVAALSNRLEDEAHKLVAGRVLLEVAVELEDDQRRLAPAAIQHAVRVLQESLRNALTHAEPSRVRITIGADRDLRLVVEDDGSGLPLEALDREHGGLANLRARAEAVGGEVDWQPGPDGGTRVTFRMPIAPST